MNHLSTFAGVCDYLTTVLRLFIFFNKIPHFHLSYTTQIFVKRNTEESNDARQKIKVLFIGIKLGEKKCKILPHTVTDTGSTIEHSEV